MVLDDKGNDLFRAITLAHQVAVYKEPQKQIGRKCDK